MEERAVLFRQALFDAASIEVMARERGAADALAGALPRGARVHVTFLANSDYRDTVAQARELHRAGFDPVPHIAARSLASRAALQDYIARLTGEAGVRRVLLIAGDLDTPRGPFAQSLDVVTSGVLEAQGVRAVGFAGHPEGHPSAPEELMQRALAAKLEAAAARGLEVEIVTQFAFEAAPILTYLAVLRRAGVSAPVRIGAAAPTDAARMLRYAVRCGVGASVRALRRQMGRLGGLTHMAGPEAMIDDFVSGFAGDEHAAVAGLHFFVFGDVARAAAWLDAHRRMAALTAG